MYKLEFTDKARLELEWFDKNFGKASKVKLVVLFDELTEHPYDGTGKPEKLRYNLSGFVSRRIDKENRLVYKVDDYLKVVTVASVRGHY